MLVAAGTDPSAVRKQAKHSKQRAAISTLEKVSRDTRVVVQAIDDQGAGETAGRVFQRLRSIYRYALSEELFETDPTQALKPSEIFRPRSVSHRLALSATDMPAFFRRLDAYEGDPSTKAALELLILTPCDLANCAVLDGKSRCFSLAPANPSLPLPVLSGKPLSDGHLTALWHV